MLLAVQGVNSHDGLQERWGGLSLGIL